MRIPLFLNCLWLLATSAGAQIRINEFLASNDTVFPDNADFDDYSDWIELHNTSASEVSLEGYFLTDDLTAPTKWSFPASSSIAAGGYLVVRADGFAAGPGEKHVRGYYPWGSTFTTRHHHTSFKLGADGEDIGLFRSETVSSSQTLIGKGASWKYRDLGTEPDATWMTHAFEDGDWPEGIGPLGYDDTWIRTEVSYGPDSSNKHATTYFRHHFTIDDPAAIDRLILNLMADDSAVIYLNGGEIARLRMPGGATAHDQYSGEFAPEENVYESIELNSAGLMTGDNVLAVEIHQVSADSSDLSFDAELVGLTPPSPPSLVDSVSFGMQTTDVSAGRDATDAWVSFGVPTPGSGNTPAPLTMPFVTSAAVTASIDSGFYDSAQLVTLSGGPVGGIHYTLDGSDPLPESPVYTSALPIATTTIVRARVLEDGKIPGPILTRSYFLNGDADPGLPVVSFVADPETIFGDDIGIYENNTTYPFKGREVPVRLEFFEEDETLAFAVGAGARIGGENIWTKAQKPFNIYCRGKYGDDFIPYQLFPGEPSGRIGEFSLRNGGDDWEETLLRDAMMPAVLDGQMDAGFYTYRPCITYLNGDFWGIYNIRKRLDPLYFNTQEYLGGDEFDFVAYAHDETGTTVLSAEEGSTDRYEALLAFIGGNDPANPDIYAQIGEQMKIDSFIDYVVATDFAVNTSWSHNREFWCGRPEGSKWEWIINDFDRGFNHSNITGSLIDDFRSSYTLFRRLDNSPSFVDRLIQRYAAHLGSTFHPQRFNEVFDLLVAEQETEIERHVARWSDRGGVDTETRLAEITEIKQFVTDRPSHALSRLQTELGISRSMSPLTITTSPQGAGSIRIAGVELMPEYNSTVNLFHDTPVEIIAEPAPGYAFTSWSNGSTDPAITVTLTGSDTLTANFVSGLETVLSSPIASDIALTLGNSPYVIDGQLTVESGATLTIDPGVEILLTNGSSILVHGTLDADGSETAPIHFNSRSGKPWGNISFVNTTTTSTLSHCFIRDATVSRSDPLNLKGAISGYDGDIVLDHVDIEGPDPIFARFGSTTMLDSRIQITFTGDGINVKTGSAHVERCTFAGNTSVDTDAIDYDGVTDGIIRDNRIYNFQGDNSDGIDVGEGCVNLLVEENRIYNNSDKGISVGQGSEVTIRQNLIVGCVLGVGVKDSGSTALIDQNTFARNDVGVAVYEKNFGAGGGTATVENCIFSLSKSAPATVDALSSLSVDYSLSDTLPLNGAGNFMDAPLFNNPGVYDFSLQSLSPAIDAGNPAHATDPDGTRADIGMSYIHDPLDYPFLPSNVIVINEVLSASPDGENDWIELHNNSNEPVDIGGWYLSDSGSDLQKYRIAAGTEIPGGGYVVFHEGSHFGISSLDPGMITPFALSSTGETVHLYKPAAGLDLEYHESEDFGAAEPGVSFGRYFKNSSSTYNFVSMSSATPEAANSLPKVGPIVISEIMYHPPFIEDAEYIELLNVSSSPVILYDEEKSTGWAIADGIEHGFPTGTPVVMQPGERLILTRSIAAFETIYSVPAGTQVIQWSSGGLSNSGETLELVMPGDLNSALERQFIRLDRINYSDVTPWPSSPDGSGSSLVRVDVNAYGNDFANWMASTASPGGLHANGNFGQWAVGESLPPGEDGPEDDPDGDLIPNLVEYALGTPPTSGENPPFQSMGLEAGSAVIEFSLPLLRADLVYAVEQSDDLVSGSWTPVSDLSLENIGNGLVLSARSPALGPKRFFRLFVSER